MKSTRVILRFIAMVSLAAVFTMGGCTKKPSQEEVGKLDQARSAAESAEKKLSELKAERIQLEQTLEQKKQDLKQNEDERDDMKAKMGTPAK